MGSKIPQAPIPPPLPPSIPATFDAKITTENTLLNQETEITKACQASWNYITNGKVDSFIISVYHQVKPILQDGPKCGLVALCMASQLLSRTLMVDTVFERAKELKFTKKGEMFSASQMRDLAEDLLCCDAVLIVDLEKERERIFKHLLLGLPLLVPYDADSNHEPCCKKGHTAHWAVITGFCIVINENQCESLKPCSKDTDSSHIIHWKSNSFPFDIDENTPIFVFARQGKSNRVQIWNFDQLCKSNKNLSEFSVKHVASDFILPKNGIQNELSNHAVLLNKC
ncbi:actin maturation protease [Centruroides vittatus]|uniref:actin maturation protease n=1 Tax=Centruroides vittatus TaxID=120091 RepID=UPI003510AC44